MTLIALLSFAAALLVLAATPGPGVFAVLGRALNSGFRKSLFTIAGIVTGDLIYLGFALSGLTWLARNVNGVFTAVRILGGIYLIYLGVKAFRTEPGRGGPGKAEEERPEGACYTEGLLITLSNPKVILFYCSFLPAFMDLKNLSPAGISLTVLTVCLVLSTVMAAYAFAAAQTGKKVHSPRGMRLLNKGSGGLMIAAGSLLALKR